LLRDMADTGHAYRSAAASAGSFVGTFALILAAIAALFVIDTFLAERERAASRSEARRLFEEGRQLERQGAAAEAVDRLRSAVSAERQNPVYQRALAAALLSAGKPAEAKVVLTERLQHDPTDAEASLIMARALVVERKLPQAIAFYHRAIYGQWDDRQAGNRLQARFELVELLAREDARQELLAELLPLQSEAPRDVRTRKRVARLFIAAGSPARAAEIFRNIVRLDAGDADAYAGLGEAELLRGNYRTARADFVRALKLRPGDRDIAARLELCDRVLALDPTQRGIGTAEQYRRSLTLLDLTVRAFDGCATPGAAMPDQAALDSARARIAQGVSAVRLSEAGERNLDLGEQVWQARRRVCSGPVPVAEKPVELVLDKLAQ
jgi:tetratricopeptide (TPR) repeat protein